MIECDEMEKVWATCSHCGSNFFLPMPPGVANDDILREANLRMALCRSCEAQFERAAKEKQQADAEREKRRELDQTYRQRLEASKLEDYYLGYDPEHPQANRALARWMDDRWRNNCVLIVGDTGECKSRIVQAYGYSFIKHVGTAYYGRAIELADTIAATFKGNVVHGRRLMEALYRCDLLIIDDLGKEVLSETRISRLFDLIDMRYTALERQRNIATGKWNPMFGGKGAGYGWRLWVTTNNSAMETIRRMGDCGEPALRRLVEMCDKWTDGRGGK